MAPPGGGGVVFYNPATPGGGGPATAPNTTLDVAGTSRWGGNVFLGNSTAGVSTLYLWPDASGSYIQGPRTGISVRAAKLDVSGAIKGNSHLGFMPWTLVQGTGTWSNGYIRLTTPIADQESNMFSLHILGYYYNGSQAIDIRCGGYAYAGTGLVNKACTASGTDLPVETTTEPGTGGNYAVVRPGNLGTTWYYAPSSVQYDGWVSLAPIGVGC